MNTIRKSLIALCILTFWHTLLLLSPGLASTGDKTQSLTQGAVLIGGLNAIPLAFTQNRGSGITGFCFRPGQVPQRYGTPLMVLTTNL